MNKNKNPYSNNNTIVMLIILLVTLWIGMGIIQIKMGVYHKAAGYFALAILGIGAAFTYYHKKN